MYMLCMHKLYVLPAVGVNRMLLVHVCLSQVTDIDGLLTTLAKACPNLRYLSLLGNQACPNELLGSGHDDEDYQRYR